jgi:hypothetical protein
MVPESTSNFIYDGCNLDRAYRKQPPVERKLTFNSRGNDYSSLKCEVVNFLHEMLHKSYQISLVKNTMNNKEWNKRFLFPLSNTNILKFGKSFIAFDCKLMFICEWILNEIKKKQEKLLIL